MSLEEYTQQWSTLHGGYVPKPKSLVSVYLRVMHVCASPFVKMRIHPDVVTLVALLVVASAPLLANSGLHLLAAVVIALTGMLDGVDGAVAVMQRKQSRWGALLDSVSDRLSESVYVLTLIVAGAPPAVLVVGLMLTMLQEYVRARAGAVGARDIGVVSLWERPTRIALASMTLLGLALTDADLVVHVTAWVWLSLACVGLIQVSRAMRQQLQN